MLSHYQALTKAKTYADDLWFDYTRMPQNYQENNPLSYWKVFLTELENQGYMINGIHTKRPESMADVS